jgi:hypothetical protein
MVSDRTVAERDAAARSDGRTRFEPDIGHAAGWEANNPTADRMIHELGLAGGESIFRAVMTRLS